MVRFIAATAGIPIIGMATPVPSAATPPMWVLLVAAVVIVVLGVNITAWLVVPRVTESTFASMRPRYAGWNPSDRDRDTEWSSTTEWQSEAWSSSWDYAGGDGADGTDDDWTVHDTASDTGSGTTPDTGTGTGTGTGSGSRSGSGSGSAGGSDGARLPHSGPGRDRGRSPRW